MYSFSDCINFIRNIFKKREVILLHELKFNGNECEYLLDCINSNYVTSVVAYVGIFELIMSLKSQTSKAIEVVNSTAGNQITFHFLFEPNQREESLV